MKNIGIIGCGDISLTHAISLALLSKGKTVCVHELRAVKAERCIEPVIKKELSKPFSINERDSDFRKRLFNSKKRYKK